MIKIKNYILNLIIEEREIIEELLNIDNRICKTNLTYSEFIKKIQKQNIRIENINTPCNFFTDGEPDTTFYILVNYALYVKSLNINRTFVGINKWLVERAKDWFFERGLEIDLNLDLDDNYLNYINDDTKAVICGFKEFTQGTEKLLNKKDILLIEMEGDALC